MRCCTVTGLSVVRHVGEGSNTVWYHVLMKRTVLGSRQRSVTLTLVRSMGITLSGLNGVDVRRFVMVENRHGN